MKTVEWHRLLRQYVLPIAMLVLSVPMTYTFVEGIFGHEDPSLLWVLVIMPIIAFLIGFVAQPEDTLLIPIIAVVLYELVAVLGQRVTYAAVIFLPFILLFGMPMWLLIWMGKRARPWFDEKIASRRHDELSPRPPKSGMETSTQS